LFDLHLFYFPVTYILPLILAQWDNQSRWRC